MALSQAAGRLPFFDKYDSKVLEEAVRNYWTENKVVERLGERRKGAKPYYLLDGPPYVNAEPHVGHVKTTACKDIWTRLRYMQGFDVHLQPGFDAHGLPVEVIVQKELGIQSKKDILALGIDKFDAKCLEKVEHNEKVWLDYYRQLGAWRASFEPYFTYKKYYIESAWWTLKTLHEKGFLREGERPTFWCPHCETVLSGYEVSDSYKDVTDPSIYVKFKVKGTDNDYLLVWTTTPWTLPANVAIFAAPQADYVKVRVSEGGKPVHYILAKERLAPVLDELVGTKYEIVDEFKGAELDGLEYEPLLDVPQQKELVATKAHRVYLSISIQKRKKYKKHKMSEEAAEKDPRKAKFTSGDANADETASASNLGEEGEYEEFVGTSDGTGLVHCAPGHGHSDHYVGKHYGLPAVSPVDERGHFTAAAGPWAGKFVKQADKEIVAQLDADGVLLYAGKVTHSYPLCWRCKNPLIYRLTSQWYLSIDSIHEQMLEGNESTHWLPRSATGWNSAATGRFRANAFGPHPSRFGGAARVVLSKSLGARTNSKRSPPSPSNSTTCTGTPSTLLRLRAVSAANPASVSRTCSTCGSTPASRPGRAWVTRTRTRRSSRSSSP